MSNPRCGGTFDPASDYNLTGAIDFTHTPTVNGVAIGTGGSSILHQTKVTITHANILTIPTAPVTLVAAPGSAKMVILLTAFVQTNVTGGDYTGISDTDPFLFVGYASGNRSSDNLYAVIVLTSQNSLTPIAVFSPGHDLDVGSSPPPGPNPAPDFFSTRILPTVDGGPGGYLNKALTISTGQLLNYTGGNVANSMTVSVAYLIYDTAIGVYI